MTSQSGKQENYQASAVPLSTTEKVKGMAKRSLAMLIDQTICLAAGILIAWPPAILACWALDEAPLAVPRAILHILVALCLLCALTGTRLWSLLYCVRFESSDWQATPGKRLLGLTVTDMQGQKIPHKSSLKRMLWQYAFISLFTLIGLILCQLPAMENNHLGYLSPVTALILPAVPLLACFLAGLFTEKGQTVFDCLAQRLVEDESWSMPKPGQYNKSQIRAQVKTGARAVFGILYTNSRGHHDWLLSICTTWSLFCLTAIMVIGLTLPGTFNELDKVDWNQPQNLNQDPHFKKASLLFKDVGLLYYYRAELGKDRFWGKTSNYQRASMSSPRDWRSHNALADIYSAGGDPGRAADELNQSIEKRKAESSSQLLQAGALTLSTTAIIAQGERIAIDDQYYKLGRLYFKTGQYQQAIKAFNEALKSKPSAEKYSALALACQAVGDAARARENFEAARKTLRIDTEIGTITLKR